MHSPTYKAKEAMRIFISVVLYVILSVGMSVRPSVIAFQLVCSLRPGALYATADLPRTSHRTESSIGRAPGPGD